MALFNFTIHYRSGVKMNHANFTFKIDIFLPKDSIGISTNTLRE